MKIFHVIIIISFLTTSCTKSSNSNTSSQSNEQIPEAPTSLTIKLTSPASITLSWTDKSTNENGFKIEKKTDGGNFVTFATVGPNTTSFQENNLPLNPSYSYRVYSFNSAGNSNTYTNTVNIPGLRDGLMAYYPFNGNANDETNNGNNGVVQGAISSVDRFGNLGSSYNFNGINSQIIINNNNIPLNGTFSISCWIKINNLTPGNWDAPIICQWNEKGYDTKFLLTYRSALADRGIAFYYKNSLNNTQGLWSKNWNPFLSQWYNCIFTFSPGNNFSCYIDGQLQFTSNSAPINLYPTNSNNQLTVGSMIQDKSWFFNGEIDDIRFYNKILNTIEINYLKSN